MTVYFSKSRQRWRYDFWRDEIRHHGYCEDLDGRPVETKTDAKRAEERIKAKLQTAPKTPAPAPGVASLAMAMAHYVPQLPATRQGKIRRAQAAELLQWFGGETPIGEIEARLPAYIAWSRLQPVRAYVGGPATKAKTRARQIWRDTPRTRSDATINRYLDALSKAIGTYGRLPDPETGAPRLAWLPKIAKLKEVKRIPRPIADGDIDKILAVAAPWVEDAGRLARHMGFRKAEMLAIRLDQVDLDNRGVWLDGEDTKGRRDEFVMANADAMAIIRRRKAQAETLGVKTLFWYVPPSKKGEPAKKARPIKDIKTAWNAARRRAGLEGARFHDFKASFITDVARFANARTTQGLARHKSFTTTERYLKIFDSDARAAVDAIASKPSGPTRQPHTPKRVRR